MVVAVAMVVAATVGVTVITAVAVPMLRVLMETKCWREFKS